MGNRHEWHLPHSDIITGLAAVDKVILQHDPHGPRNVAHGKTLDVLLDLDLLVVTTLDRTSTCRHKNIIIIMTGTWSAEPAHALSAYTFLLASQEMELKKMFLKKVFFLRKI